MCYFCKSDITRTESKKGFSEKCIKCKALITKFNNNDKVLVFKFPRKDRIRTVLLFSPIILMGFLVLILVFGGIFDFINADIFIMSFLGVQMLLWLYGPCVIY